MVGCLSSGCCRRYIIGASVQPGSPSILSMEVRSLSQFARLEQQICALGRMSIGLSIDPAGTTSKPISGWETGSADPQAAQKLFIWRELGRRNVLMFSSPDTHVIWAVDENRFAEWAEPLSLRQREQWHRKKLSNLPDMRNFTAPQRHCPVVGLLSIHTPRDRQALPPVERISLFPCIRVLDPGQKGAQRETVSASQNISELKNMPSDVHGPEPPLDYLKAKVCFAPFRALISAIPAAF